MSVQDGQRSAALAIMLIVGLFPLATATAQDDEDIDLDDIDLDAVETLADDAATLQAQAIAAAVDERWDIARQKALAALTLDTTVGTAQSRLVLARALEALGDPDAALREVDNYLGLPLLTRDVARGQEIRERIVDQLRARDRAAAHARETQQRQRSRSRLAPGVRQQRGGAIGLLAGGAVPTVMGIWFVGTDLNYATRGIDSGTWAAIGAPLLITGLAMEAIGGVILATSSRRPARSARLQLHGGVAPGVGGGMHLGLWGRF